ncbi:MAG: UPF0175 family protein [Thermoplasmata archaeon]
MCGRFKNSESTAKNMSQKSAEDETKKAVSMLEQGRISFSAAAEMAEMDVWDFTEYLKSENVEWVDSETVRDDIEDL